jgi:hypothetical protein
MGNWSRNQDCLAAIGFSRNATDGVTSNETFDPPLMPCT